MLVKQLIGGAVITVLKTSRRTMHYIHIVIRLHLNVHWNTSSNKCIVRLVNGGGLLCHDLYERSPFAIQM